jgi:RNA polymerase sigma-70 factor, ECF subfamily
VRRVYEPNCDLRAPINKASALQGAEVCELMTIEPSDLVRSGLRTHLARLWRYGLALSGRRDVAEDLVQATCLRALERENQFQPGTHLDRWLFSILHSIWLNEVRARQIRQRAGFANAETSLAVDGARQMENGLVAAQVLREAQRLPEAQRGAVFLVYVEGLSYREAADVLAVPIGTIMSRLATARVTLGRCTGADGHQRAMGELQR